jgi:L-malate glycosyltransferase
VNLFSRQRNETGRTRELPTICHVLHTLNVGGAELLARDFALEHQDRFRPVFVCLDAIGTIGKELRAKGYTVEVIGRCPGFDYRCVWRLSQFMRQQKVALVHAHQYAPFFYSSLARNFGPGYPILFTEHGRDNPDFRRMKRVWANKVLLRRRDHVIAVGKFVRNALVENEGLPANRIEVIYNGVDAKQFDPKKPNRDRLRNVLKLHPQDIGVVQVARLNRLKDYGTALEAMARVCRVAPNVKYFIVGEGEERATIESSIDQLNLHGQAKMLGLRQDVPQLLEAMDVFLLSSVTEGIPLTLIEAMFAQLPCVATRVGGIEEVVLDGITGLLSDANDPDAIASKILRLNRSADTRSQLGKYGRERALRLFDSHRMFEEYECLYAQLTSTRVEPCVAKLD